jgi:hypothetical protein
MDEGQRAIRKAHLSFQLRLAKKQIDDIPGPEVEFEKNGIF